MRRSSAAVRYDARRTQVQPSPETGNNNERIGARPASASTALDCCGGPSILPSIVLGQYPVLARPLEISTLKHDRTDGVTMPPPEKMARATVVIQTTARVFLARRALKKGGLQLSGI